MINISLKDNKNKHMKNLKKSILIVAALVLSITINAQEKLTEGVIVTKMTMSSPNEQVQAQLAMIGEIVSTTYFKNEFTRSETNSPMTGEATSIIDTKNKKMLTIMNSPALGGKIYSENFYEPSEEDLKNITITKGDKTKTILGYNCNEYNVVTKVDGNEIKMTMYATEAIQAVNQQTAAFGDDFKGFPMYMEVNVNQMGMDMRMTYEATKINAEKVSDDKFNMTAPEGYKKMDKIPGM